MCADISVREMLLSEVEIRIRYFHEASDAHLTALGVDRALLPEPPAWRAFHEKDYARPSCISYLVPGYSNSEGTDPLLLSFDNTVVWIAYKIRTPLVLADFWSLSMRLTPSSRGWVRSLMWTSPSCNSGTTVL
jgi:hypothetical protein